MSNPVFTLVLSDGARLTFEPHSSRLTDAAGDPIDLTPVHGAYRSGGCVRPAIAVSPGEPGRKRGLKRIKIQMGLRCNYACSYCSQASHRVIEKDRPLGDVDRLVHSLKAVLSDHQGDGDGLLIEFWGGEPFVYWRVLKPLAETLRQVFPRAEFGLTTNGSLLDDDKVDWLDAMGFGVAISHDGPGYHVRGDDPLDDPAKLSVIRRMYHRLRPQNRLSFNCVLNVQNPSLLAVLDFLRLKMDDPSVVVSTEGIALALEPSAAMLMPRSDADHRCLRRTLLADCKTDDVIYQISTVHMMLTDFFEAVERGRQARVLGQKCGMDREDAIAVDLDGNVVTCQNTSASGGHRIGHIDDLSGVRLSTATHWSHRDACVHCPVVQLCKGGCMYQEGPEQQLTCDGHFTFHVALLAAAVWAVTGKDLAAIEGEHIRFPGITSFDF